MVDVRPVARIPLPRAFQEIPKTALIEFGHNNFTVKHDVSAFDVAGSLRIGVIMIRGLLEISARVTLR